MFPLRLRLNRYGIPAILIWGHPFVPFLPKSNVDLRIAIGPPIQLPRIDNPTPMDVTQWHTRYMDELLNLFYNYQPNSNNDSINKSNNKSNDDRLSKSKKTTSQLEIW
jgi:Diacylglycerol acyltransferase